MSDEIFIPPIAQKMIDRLTDATGVPPTVRRYINGLLLEHTSEQVGLTIHYKLRGRKWAWSGSTLILDGVKQKILAHGFDDYVQIFKLGRRQKLTDGAEKGRRPEYLPADVTAAPAAIHEAFTEQLTQARRLDKIGTGSEVTLHRHEGYYVIQIRIKELTVYLYYRLQHGEWMVGWEPGLVFALTDDDYDVSQRLMDFGGDIAKLLELIDLEVPEIDVPRQINRHADPKRLNSVEVRRTSVIRV